MAQAKEKFTPMKSKDYFVDDEDDWDTSGLMVVDNEVVVKEEKLQSPKLELEEEKKPIPIPNEIPLLSSEAVHSKLVKDGNISPKLWNFDEVIQFLTMNGCATHAQILSEKKTDGIALLKLNKETLAVWMELKDALTLSRIITKLRALEDGYVRKHAPPPPIIKSEPEPDFSTPINHSMDSFRIPKRKVSLSDSRVVSQSPLVSYDHPEKRRRYDDRPPNSRSSTSSTDDEWDSTSHTPTSSYGSSPFQQDQGSGFRGRGRGGRGGGRGRGRGGGASGGGPDWVCVCGISNYGSRWSCFKCRALKSDNNGSASSGGQVEPSATTTSADDEDWGDSSSSKQPGQTKIVNDDDDWGASSSSAPQGHSKIAGDVDEWGESSSAKTGQVAPSATTTSADDEDWGDSSSSKQPGHSKIAGDVDEWGESSSAKTEPKNEVKRAAASGNEPGHSKIAGDVNEWGESSSAKTEPKNEVKRAAASGNDWDDWGDSSGSARQDNGDTSFQDDRNSSFRGRGGRGGGRGEFRGRGGGRGRGRGGGSSGGEDWFCGCGTSNFAHRRACYKCFSVKPEGSSVGNTSSARNDSTTSGNNNDWGDWGDSKSASSKPEPKNEVKRAAASGNDWDDWGDSSGSARQDNGDTSFQDDRNSSFRGRGGRGGGRGEFRGRGGGRGRGRGGGSSRGEDWFCGCGTSNFAYRRACYKCFSVKPEGSSVGNTSSVARNDSTTSGNNNDWGDWGDSKSASSKPEPKNEVKRAAASGNDWDDWGDSSGSARQGNEKKAPKEDRPKTPIDEDGW